ncbi:MAG: zinc ribbon domain-containing protein [Actinomycetota bacterium]
MPTYDYRCEACGHRFELSQSIKDDPITVCPNCGEEAVVKVFGVPGIAFKGSGFYKTDSRSTSGSSSSTSSSNGDSGSSSSGSSDSSSSSSSSDSSSTSTSSGHSSSGGSSD